MIATVTGKYASVLIALCAASALFAAGCSERSSNDSSADTGLSPNSPNVTYPKDWTEVAIDANSAKNTIDTAGHYHTDHNMCQRPGDGVYDLSTWNSLSGALNQVVLSAPLATERCWDSPNGSKFYNRGSAEITISHTAAGATSPVVTHRNLFEYKNAQICTTIADPALADALMAQIESTLQLSDRADAQQCPNYVP